MYKLLNIKNISPSQHEELVNLFTKKINNYVPSITFLTRYQLKKFEERCVEKKIHGKYVTNVDYKEYHSSYKDPFIIFLKKNKLKIICDPPQDFNAKGESTRMTRFHFKTKEFILTRFSTLAILPH